mmetsp:Transcript_35876/g.75523  ORF Transcript_35876/g.75523 Transcript_35876/m.75523 type:complete len:474 (+) Transcript_35876:206-1627(+)
MSRGRNSSWQIAKIFKDITWDAGIVARSAFRGIHKPRKKKAKPTEFVRFVYKGQYYRRPIAPRNKKNKPPQLLKLPPAGPQVVPQPFVTPPNATTVAQKAEALVASNAGAGSSQQSTWSWKSWWKLNAPLLILNFGSFAMLMGFTRSDVLELRCLAITGNISFVVYSLLIPPPIRWAAVGWSGLFATVNAYNIGKILNEREGKVYLAEHEKEIYHEHFEPHGVTPKQFEKVMKKGVTKIVKKGDVLSRQGEQISSVKLVVKGDTRANVMGRHLTAMGSVRGNRYSLQGGDSGAWVGEMAFLQSLWDRDHPTSLRKRISGDKSKTNAALEEDAKPELVTKSVTGLPVSDEQYKYCSISTIVAVEDIEVIEWSFEDMQKVMKSSRYIQEALTRAMTAAVVGKVVNFMVSRQTGMPKWSTLLDNWKHASPRRNGEEEEEEEVAGAPEEEDEEERSLTLNGQPLATSVSSWFLSSAR